MANPYGSPWLKPVRVWFKDYRYKVKYDAIKLHTTTKFTVTEYNAYLVINKNVYLSKNSDKFRLRSHIDWAWYDPKTLAQAIDSDTVESYYEIMLTHCNSDPNIWKDPNEEMELKSLYAARVGRASLL